MPVIDETETYKKSDDYDLECERCHKLTHMLFASWIHKFIPMEDIDEDFWKDEPNENKKKIWICEECDWECMNGIGERDEFTYEDQDERDMRRYEEDPINNAPPWLSGERFRR